jgi:hypothetical protein
VGGLHLGVKYDAIEFRYWQQGEWAAPAFRGFREVGGKIPGSGRPTSRKGREKWGTPGKCNLTKNNSTGAKALGDFESLRGPEGPLLHDDADICDLFSAAVNRCATQNHVQGCIVRNV